jgi:Domain of unknown function (DUF4178)
MSRQLQCPNCGGEHTLVNPGITMLVCDYCKTVVYWGEQTALQTGRQSILPEADTRLFMHASGKLMGRSYEVAGHLRYDHGRGTWDEWYLQMDDGGVAWLSEDERKLSLEQFLRPDPSMPPPGQLQPGNPVTLDGVGYTVREVGNAVCAGGEGQLPFTVLPGEQYPYVDLASHDGTQFATLEYDSDGAPRCFTGQVLDHETLTVDDERPPSTAGSHQGKHIECPNCAAPLEVSSAGEVQTQVCEYCGAQNDLTGAEAVVLGVNPKDFDPGFWFEIGQGGTFRNKRYEICGRMLFEDDEGYEAREYLLYSPEEGYLWLAEEKGHFVLNRPTQQAPAYDPFRMAPKQGVKVGAQTFQFYEWGTSKLVYVDGALPWQACSGDRSNYADLIAPPQMFGVETDGNEVEYFLGWYMTAEEVYKAFEIKDKPPRSVGVHPAQPFKRSAAATILMIAGLLFAVVNLGLVGWSLVSKGRLVLSETFSAQRYLREATSETFKVGNDKIMAMRIDAPLNNSWLALDVALLDVDKSVVVGEADGEISYYQGVEGGESWSEGNRSTTNYFRAPPPGNYKLILKASAGSGLSRGARGEPLTIRIYQGGAVTRYFLVAFIITFLVPFFIISRKVLFEKQRWAPVLGGDDDDDDDDWD